MSEGIDLIKRVHDIINRYYLLERKASDLKMTTFLVGGSNSKQISITLRRMKSEKKGRHNNEEENKLVWYVVALKLSDSRTYKTNLQYISLIHSIFPFRSHFILFLPDFVFTHEENLLVFQQTKAILSFTALFDTTASGSILTAVILSGFCQHFTSLQTHRHVLFFADISTFAFQNQSCRP